MSIAFCAEKITGALYFLKNLKSLTQLYPQANSAISRIKELNQKNLGLFETQKGKLESEIKELQKKIEQLTKDLSECEEKIDSHDKRIAVLVNEEKENKKHRIRESYIERHQEYEEVIQKLNGGDISDDEKTRLQREKDNHENIIKNTIEAKMSELSWSEVENRIKNEYDKSVDGEYSRLNTKCTELKGSISDKNNEKYKRQGFFNQLDECIKRIVDFGVISA